MSVPHCYGAHPSACRISPLRHLPDLPIPLPAPPSHRSCEPALEGTHMSATLSTFSDQLADAVERGARSVVSVHARPRLPSTGVHWRDGVIITTEATVQRDANIAVTLPDGRRVPAQLKGRAPSTDLAVLSIPTGLLPAATLGDPTALRPGHLVLAL